MNIKSLGLGSKLQEIEMTASEGDLDYLVDGLAQASSRLRERFDTTSPESLQLSKEPDIHNVLSRWM